MNIIEQLGGYRMAKEVMDGIPKDGRSYSITRDDTGISFNTAELHDALLEYRRANGIFEVGDSVLPISGHSDQVHFLADWYIENLDFRYTTNSGSWGIIVKALMDGAWRHATDAERQAGKRLPRLEVLNDIDIPPNTIILGDK